jgi:hypothetical protein
MKTYEIMVEPIPCEEPVTWGGVPVTWETTPVLWVGQAVNIMDALLTARRQVVPDIGAHDKIARSYFETCRITAHLPCRVVVKGGAS